MTVCGQRRFTAPSRPIHSLANDVLEVRELFAWASIETVELSYQAGGAEHTKRVREVVIAPPL